MKNNFATMHSALTSAYMVLVKAYQDHCQIPPAELARVISILEQAIAIKPRNCDEGTAKEQYERLHRFCISHECRLCPCKTDKNNGECSIAWTQMPYKGGRKCPTRKEVWNECINRG